MTDVVTTYHRLLVVDDEESQRELVQAIFADGPYVCTVAVDGYEALAAARAEPPDLVLTDINMPNMDGFGLIQQLQVDPRTTAIPVIAVTANTSPDDITRLTIAGFADYFAKPYDIHQLRHRVHELLAGVRGTDA